MLCLFNHKVRKLKPLGVLGHELNLSYTHTIWVILISFSRQSERIFWEYIAEDIKYFNCPIYYHLHIKSTYHGIKSICEPLSHWQYGLRFSSCYSRAQTILNLTNYQINYIRFISFSNVNQTNNYVFIIFFIFSNLTKL